MCAMAMSLLILACTISSFLFSLLLEESRCGCAISTERKETGRSIQIEICTLTMADKRAFYIFFEVRRQIYLSLFHVTHVTVSTTLMNGESVVCATCNSYIQS